MAIEEPIFVIGNPRSGTTLLQCMLSAHTRIFSFPETHFFSEAMRKIDKPADETLASDETQRVFDYLTPLMNVNKKFFYEFWDGHDTNSVTGKHIFEFIIEYFRPKDDLNKSLRALEKTPMHAFFVEEIFRLYNDAKFIHIVREPKDALSSSIKLPANRSNWIPLYVYSWTNILQTVEAFAESFPDSVLTIRYEDLISKPEFTIRKNCEFLDIEFELEMVSNFSREYEKNVIAHIEHWKNDVKSGEIIQNEEKWRNRVSESQGWLIEVQANEFMKKYGYQCLCSPRIGKKFWIVFKSIFIAVKENQRLKPWLSLFFKRLLSNYRYKSRLNDK